MANKELRAKGISSHTYANDDEECSGIRRCKWCETKTIPDEEGVLGARVKCISLMLGVEHVSDQYLILQRALMSSVISDQYFCSVQLKPISHPARSIT
jgi:hypothetical protein